MKTLQLICWCGGDVGDISPVILRIRLFCNKHVGNVGPASPTLYTACIKTSMRTALQTAVSLQARAHFSSKQAGSSHRASPFQQPGFPNPPSPGPNTQGPQPCLPLESTPFQTSSTAFEVESRCPQAGTPHPSCVPPGLSAVAFVQPQCPEDSMPRVRGWGPL